jgi:predicted nuclease of restriction endonuclease-like RecB superfamily
VGRARDAGAWIPELIEAFERRFAEVAPGWRVDREVPLLTLGADLVVPDFRFVHAESGWEGCLEVLGYWRRGGVDRRLKALRAHGAPRLVLALEQALRVGDDDLVGIEGPVVPFREVPDARKVLRCLEELRARDAEPPRPKRRRKAKPAPA